MPNTFETILEWLSFNNDVNLLVPKITSTHGEVQKLCKRNPTVLAMFSRRFIPAWLKPDWLRRYDEWYTMSEYDYNKIFDVPLLADAVWLLNLLPSFHMVVLIIDSFYI